MRACVFACVRACVREYVNPAIWYVVDPISRSGSTQVPCVNTARDIRKRYTSPCVRPRVFKNQ